MAEHYEAQWQIDITYHYPPELLELLCDAVPALFRSKQAVIDFFVGAGVPNKLVADWKLKLQQDKESVKKHEMARSVLCGLNDEGEPTLAVRREVLKRISQFEDFSSCWESDRYKARGLVAQIQKLVNVKTVSHASILSGKGNASSIRLPIPQAFRRNVRKPRNTQRLNSRYTNCLRKRTLTSGVSSLRPC